MSSRLLSRFHYVQPARELTETEAEALYLAGRLPSPSEAEDIAGEYLLAALELRRPVTVGFWEQRKAKDPADGKVRVVKGPDKQPLMVHTVRTYELFDIAENESNGQIRFLAVDRCPRDPDNPDAHGKPGIRSVVASRVTDVTIHDAPYRTRNQYFIDKVRDAVPGAANLTDDTIWHIIRTAPSRADAEQLAHAALADAR